jgi:S-DNA-T family DNA segregation ATPase FtsK/SpoIIIE
MFTPISNLLTKKLSLPGGSLIRGLLGLFWKAIVVVFKFQWLKFIFKKKESYETIDETDGQIEEPFEEIDESEQIIFEDDERETEIIEATDDAEETEIDSTAPAKQLQMKSLIYSYPKVELLETNPSVEESIDKEELLFTARMLKETLETFGVQIEGDIAYYPGPIITRYEFKPGVGIKINQIVNLSDDLALALKAKRIRIIAPIPGKAAVGVEIPNRITQMVYLRDIIESEQFKNSRMVLPIALGKTTSGKPFVADLTKMPHLLIAGATGSGKSVGINSIITSLLYRLHPLQIRFIFIDPKMLELSVYSGIPHLGRPVVTKPKRAERVLTDAVTEMENRYRKLANASVRNIADFNTKQTDEEKKLPYIVICVDELADLMMSATSSKIEHLITRLAQMSRAVGIHLILATQRPSVDVITGLIKANFPARIAFQVSSKVDSRTILDGNGAEKLLGLGDMLFLETGQPEPQRIHGAFISSKETEEIVEFIRNQGIEMMALEGITQSSGEPTEAEVDIGDPLFKEACEVVIRHKQGSVSLLQRRLGIGYQRAARLIDKLEQAGIVSGFDGSKARDLLVDKTYLDSLFASSKSNSQIDSEKN